MDLLRFLGVKGGAEQTPSEEGVAIDLSSITAADVPLVVGCEGQQLLDRLREVIDPELGINIVDLGLVYAVERVGDRVDVVLTMTTPICPLSAVIEADVREALVGWQDQIEQVRVAVIFEPPWTPAMMSDEARRLLG